MKWFRRVTNRFSVMGELYRFLWKQRLFWMIPMVSVLLILGILLIFAQSSPVGPMIYAIF